jgi:lipoyl(octanoyl) transferase
MINLKRRKMGVRQLVTLIEEGIVNALAKYNINAYPKADAPGVYVNDKKVASLGLRVRKGCSFHGLALNVNMDLEPFLRINPCGYAGLEMVQTADINGPKTVEEAGRALLDALVNLFEATELQHLTGLDSKYDS